MKFCGIDLHSNNCVVVITDETDRILVSRRCPNDLSKEINRGLSPIVPWRKLA